MKTQYLPQMFSYRQNPRVVQEGEHDGDVRFLTESRNMAVSRMHSKKICNLALTCVRIAKIPSSSSANTMVTSDF